MKLETRSFRSKVARRIFALFMVCALLPIGALSLVALVHVSRQFDEQSRTRLVQASKAHGMAIFDRLSSAEATLKLVAAVLGTTDAGRRLPADPGERFDTLALVGHAAAAEVLLGGPFALPAWSDEAQRHLDQGDTVVSTTTDSKGTHVLMTTGVAGRAERLVGTIRPDYLWGADGLSEATDLCVFDAERRAIASSTAACDALSRAIDTRDESRHDAIEWRAGSTSYLSGAWALFLNSRFHTPAWTIALSEELRDVQGPIGVFRRSFAWITLGSLSVVVLLSLVQIRRHLGPLEALREGTRRIADRDFSARVVVTTNDEFRDLADSFNRMAGRLGKQFHSLSAINEIDKAVLSKLTSHDVLGTALEGLRSLVRCEELGIALLEQERQARMYLRSAQDQSFSSAQVIELRSIDLDRLRGGDSFLLDGAAGGVPSYAAPLAARGSTSYLTLPLGKGEALTGFVCFGQGMARGFEEEDIQQVRQVCDQISVALANARLVDELDRFSWGTLRALARAIDAKSPWTAGHSERVTDLALRIGRRVGLSPRELDTLRRGGLLHDIGKIGVPAAVLDKPGRLSEQELLTMRDHVRIGASILEPLTAFGDALPIVTEHHEWFNGQGYPNGLKGDGISLSGRIFAVADVYDALTSSRPYRRGMPRWHAAALIEEGSGRQFDPAIVAVFLEVLADEPEEALVEDDPRPQPAAHLHLA
jgi:putative nucleotidyltransferase with HDIG domain